MAVEEKMRGLGVKEGFARCFAQRVAGGRSRVLQDLFICMAVMDLERMRGAIFKYCLPKLCIRYL